MDDVLYHYGVKGMKWGVRRYRNYDGTYTQRGLKRYQEAEKKYDDAVSAKKKAKSDLKSNKSSENQIAYKRAKRKVKDSERELKTSYKKLKTDKLADQGKELYKRGKTITGNTQMEYLSRLGISTVASVAVRQTIEQNNDAKLANISAGAILVGSAIVNGLIYGKTQYQNKRLRAYYAH